MGRLPVYCCLSLINPEVPKHSSFFSLSLSLLLKDAIPLIFLLGELSETLTNESQLRFWCIYIYMAKFKEVNACPSLEAT